MDFGKLHPRQQSAAKKPVHWMVCLRSSDIVRHIILDSCLLQAENTAESELFGKKHIQTHKADLTFVTECI